MAKTFPYTYTTQRKIRGELRSVKVTKYSRLKESLHFLDPKDRQRHTRIITRKEARAFHNNRSKRAKVMDARKTVPLTRTAKFLIHPDRYDYPGVDNRGRGYSAGEGQEAGRKLRHAVKKGRKKRGK